ncbi:putative membrane protein [Paraburkholderia kururiensis]
MQLAAFLGGWFVLAAALVSPLDSLANLLFSAHMVQHEAMMIVAAPLLVLGRPLCVWMWAMPHGMRRAVGAFVRVRVVKAAWRHLTSPVSAWLLHAVALWAWHAPALFEAALADPIVHTLQHASFLASALVLWWTMFPASGRAGGSTRGSGAAMLSLFTTMVHTGALGALIALSPGVWYPSYIERSSALGFDPLSDQQLGGLIMWVPGAAAYLVGALVIAARWLARPASPSLIASEARMAATEDSP